MQLKEPGVLWHCKAVGHIEGTLAHSSISKKKDVFKDAHMHTSLLILVSLLQTPTFVTTYLVALLLSVLLLLLSLILVSILIQFAITTTTNDVNNNNVCFCFAQVPFDCRVRFKVSLYYWFVHYSC